jgi:hypothetical protein
MSPSENTPWSSVIIENMYREHKYGLGWRFLTCPASYYRSHHHQPRRRRFRKPKVVCREGQRLRRRGLERLPGRKGEPSKAGAKNVRNYGRAAGAGAERLLCSV